MPNLHTCDVCEGTGRERLEGERTMLCNNGCDNGFFPAEARDLDGKRARYGFVVGLLGVWDGVLVLEGDDGVVVVNLDPQTVELL
jgi:hypothetical protein